MPGPPFRLSDVAPYAPLALIGGAFVGFFMRGMRWDVGPLVGGAIIGFSCFAFAVGAEYVFHGWLERYPEQWWRRVLTYFIASQIGWLLPVFVLMPLLTGGRANVRVGARGSVLLITIGLSAAGTLVGFTVYGYEKLKSRLAASIQELKEREFAEKELELAREFQARMLPAPEIAAEGYRISSRNFAARYVAGDFYDVFNYGDGAVGIVVADVAGKGLPASLIMTSVKAVLPLLAGSRPIGETMKALNEKLIGELAKREFVALLLARFDPRSGVVSFVNAGLPDPYLLRRDRVEAVTAPGPRLPLGLRKSLDYQPTQVDLQSGEAMVFLSDGLPEARTPDGDPLGYERLAAILSRTGPQVDAILQQVQVMTTDAREDDQTVVILERL
jgi:hypothetical protein